MPGAGWEWDATLYAGSAAHYSQGRVPYPRALVEALVAELVLDGRGRLLDLGCGPGSLTLPLAAHFEQVVAVDADSQMLEEGRRLADAAGIPGIQWLHSRAEDLPASLGGFRLATLAQSFHWMDRRRVADLLRRQLLAPDGALAFVHATTHQGVEGGADLPHPRPPRRDIDALVAAYLGPRRRAGAGLRLHDAGSDEEPGRIEAEVFDAAGFTGPTRLEVPGRVVTRTEDEVVASVFSLSFATPRLFGDRMASFERDLRRLLADTSPAGTFSEQMREIAIDVWR